MAIRASSARQIDSLIGDLGGGDEVRRDAAVARLTVIGARAVDRLIGVAGGPASAGARSAALRALEGIGDERALSPALVAAADDDEAVALAAVRVARSFIAHARGAEVVDALTSIVLDRHRPDVVRATAVRALQHLDAKTISPLLKSLADDPSAAVRAAINGTPRSRAPRSSHSPRDWVVREGPKAPLTSILEMIQRIREREGTEPAATRSQWMAARFAAHRVLASRGSRIALYDLRESLETADAPLPADAAAALSLIGDASCLEPIASAYGRTKNKQWRDQLLDLFHAIVKREKLTPRHAVMRKVEKKLSTP